MVKNISVHSKYLFILLAFFIFTVVLWGSTNTAMAQKKEKKQPPQAQQFDFDKQVQKISGGRAGVSYSFPVNDLVTGLVLRGRTENQQKGQEIMAFGLPDGSVIIEGDVYDSDGINLTQKFSPVINRMVIKHSVGLYQSEKLLKLDNPVKTLFAFIDPACSSCRTFREGEMPSWFEKQNVQILWIPVTLFERSESLGALFLDQKLWPECSVCSNPSATALTTTANKAPIASQSGLETVYSNTKRLLRVYGQEKVFSPYLVWLTDDSEKGYQYFYGIPTKEDAERMVKEMLPVEPLEYGILK